MKKVTLLVGCFCLIINLMAHGGNPPKVLLIGIDGMSSSGFQHAYTPNLDKIASEGLLTLNARIAIPSVSAPNWATHLMGAGPEQHGVTFNGWTPYSTILQPICADAAGYFPSIFTAIHQQRPDLKTAFFYDWKELAYLFNPAYIDYSRYKDPEHFKENVREAADYWISEKPDFTFLYIGYPDEVGHHYKWESPQYIRAIEEVEESVGYLLNKMIINGLYNETYIVVVSDHGGVEYSHGGLTETEMNVPWMINGPGLVRGKLYGLPFNSLQTAPTIISLLGMDVPDCWIGRPAQHIFQSDEQSSIHKGEYVPAPALNFKKCFSLR
ncbi:MAG: alkaline phosphatase family protein [Bacteroidales bacterium]